MRAIITSINKSVIVAILICVCIFICADRAYATAYTESEGNNYISNADVINVSTGNTFSGSLSDSDEIDFIKFTLTKGAEINLDIYGRKPDTSYTYGSVLLDFYKATNTNREFYYINAPYNYNLGYYAKNENVYLSEGTYYVRINNSTSGKINYKLSFNTTLVENFKEPNNYIGEATNIVNGQKYYGVLESYSIYRTDNEYDFFVADVKTESDYYLIVKNINIEGYNFDVSTLNSSGESIKVLNGESYLGVPTGMTKTMLITLPAGKTYFRFDSYVYSGKYEFTLVNTVNENVVRIAGSNRCDTALLAADKLKKELGVNKFDNIIVATALNFADALPGSYLAAELNAPILLTMEGSDAKVRDYIENNLKPGGNVYVIGGEGAVPDRLMGYIDFTRISGTNRYLTNLALLDKVPVQSGDTIMVCTGEGFADSLSASATGNPILLADDGLTADQIDFLKGIKKKCNFCMIGGTGVVPKSLERAFEEYDKDGIIERAAGTDRYSTSVAVAKHFFGSKSPKDAVLAYAMNFPDGLSGGPLAHAIGGPLILTDSTSSNSIARNYITGKGIEGGYVLGGPTLISDDAVNVIFGTAMYVGMNTVK